jgi:hypothetical protein
MNVPFLKKDEKGISREDIMKCPGRITAETPQPISMANQQLQNQSNSQNIIFSLPHAMRESHHGGYSGLRNESNT